MAGATKRTRRSGSSVAALSLRLRVSVVWAVFLSPIKAQAAEDRERCRGRGLRPRNGRGARHHPRSDSRSRACWSICEPTSAIASPRARSSPASTTASRQPRSPGPRRRSSRAEANLQRAKASVDKAKANFANTKSINERRQKLVQTNVTSVETAETAQAAQDAAAADLSLANSDVLVAEANIGDAKAQQQLQSATLDFHTLTAPYDAMVTARLKELGSALGDGEPVFTLIDPKSVWALAYIDESKAGEIRVGEPADIVLRSRPGQRIPRPGRPHRARKRPRQRRAAGRGRIRPDPGRRQSRRTGRGLYHDGAARSGPAGSGSGDRRARLRLAERFGRSRTGISNNAK